LTHQNFSIELFTLCSGVVKFEKVGKMSMCWMKASLKIDACDSHTAQQGLL